jgi:hypothetical protein
MTRDEINRLIQDNGLFHGTVSIGAIMDMNHLERLVALVAAAEREACACTVASIAGDDQYRWAADAIRARGETRLFDDWGGGFPYKQKAWNGLTESQVMDFCKEARQIGVHSLLWKVNNLLKQQNT